MGVWRWQTLSTNPKASFCVHPYHEKTCNTAYLIFQEPTKKSAEGFVGTVQSRQDIEQTVVSPPRHRPWNLAVCQGRLRNVYQHHFEVYSRYMIVYLAN